MHFQAMKLENALMIADRWQEMSPSLFPEALEALAAEVRRLGKLNGVIE